YLRLSFYGSGQPGDPQPFLHDALPICPRRRRMLFVEDRGHDLFDGSLNLTVVGQCPDDSHLARAPRGDAPGDELARVDQEAGGRSEEHTSELQSREKLVCRLRLEKKKP